MADDPLRLRILKGLTDSLKTITPANGYVHDLSQSVVRGVEYFGDDEPVPLVSILESPDEAFQEPAPKFSAKAAGPWRLFVQGWVDDDKENPTDPAHILMADVKKRLGIEAKAAGYLQGEGAFGMKRAVDSISFSPGVVRPPDAISARAYFWLILHIVVVEDLTDPYSLNV